MFCQKCGKENPEEAKFCRRCGKRIRLLSLESSDSSAEDEQVYNDTGRRIVIVGLSLVAVWFLSQSLGAFLFFIAFCSVIGTFLYFLTYRWARLVLIGLALVLIVYVYSDWWFFVLGFYGVCFLGYRTAVGIRARQDVDRKSLSVLVVNSTPQLNIETSEDHDAETALLAQPLYSQPAGSLVVTRDLADASMDEGSFTTRELDITAKELVSDSSVESVTEDTTKPLDKA